MKPSEIPVLVLGFNRPELMRTLIKRLAEVRPMKIYFSVDGPRQGIKADEELVAEVQRCVHLIDWDCNVQTLFRPFNIGLKSAVIQSLDWIFNNEEQAIILEDDCHPIPEFFDFCAMTLTRYANESKIMQISGNCFVPISDLNKSIYYFSSLNDIWGWATWRRAWLKFERTVPPHDELEVQNRIQKYFQNHEIEKWFSRYLREAASNESQVWSTQWTLTLINNAGLTVVPQTNLVTNVGFISDATHMTSNSFKRYSEFAPKKIEAKQIPIEIIRNEQLDLQRFSLIKATDLNLRVSSRIRTSIRQIALDLFPKPIIVWVRVLKKRMTLK